MNVLEKRKNDKLDTSDSIQLTKFRQISTRTNGILLVEPTKVEMWNSQRSIAVLSDSLKIGTAI